MNLSVTIPSRNIANLVPCVEAVRRCEPEARIIVVDDGLPPYSLHPDTAYRVEGEKPFIFARNVNLGIAAAGTDDVIILNDDAILQTPGGFLLLACAAQENPEFGIIASTCNNVGNRNQFPRPMPMYDLAGRAARRIGLREDPRMVCFVAVCIPRRTINTVGLLDTRFSGYGLDDDDYSLRVRLAGLKIGIHDGCYVDHGSLTSSYRGGPETGGDFRPNLRIFIQKYGVDNWGRTKETSQFPELFA